MVNKKSINTQQQLIGKRFNLNPMTAAVRLALTGVLATTLSQSVQAELPVAATNWVSSGAASKVINGHRMDITQTTNKAVMNWQKFNIGVGNHVNFAQPGSSSVALNRIGQSDPSRILGKLTANGQVYLINQNGFVFGKDSVINTNSFIASTHNITDDVFERGITRVFDETGEAAFVLDSAIIEADQAMLKKILIESGAEISVDDTGRLMLVASKIENRGTLKAGNKSQIILVASQDKVYLQQANAEKEGFAGLLVEVDTGGEVSNFGDILAKQGNITMAGFAVNQNGRVNATTSVTVNGSIRLQAREGHAVAGSQLIGKETTRDTDLDDGLGKKATLTFAEDSLTTITLDDSKGKVIDKQLQPDSLIVFSAHDIEFKGGSQVIAPAAKLEITATNNLSDPLQGNQGRILMEEGSVIDVSGIRDVKVAMERNVGEVNVKSNELRDSPFQRDSVLKNAIVNVDIRKETEIIDASITTSGIKRSVFERMTQGGDIKLTASGQIDVQKGVLIDISGGSVDTAAGSIETSYLKSQTGQIVEISDANPDDRYVGITKQKYFEQAYTEGKDAGRLAIKTSDLQWQGTLDASVINGRKQRSLDTMARGGTFSIDMAVFNATQNIAFNNGDAFSRLALSGLQDLSLKTWGDVSIAQDVALAFKPLSNITIEAGSINIKGDVYSAGGKLNFAAKRNKALNTSGELLLEKGAVLDVSGRWVNDLLTENQGVNPTEALVIDGGEVVLSAQGDLITEQGSAILANGGARLTEDEELIAGKGGDISLQAVGLSATPSLLYLGAKLSAQALHDNGRLTLTSNKFVISDHNKTDADSKTNYIDANHALFSEFSSISLNAAFDSIELQGKADINLTQSNRQFLHGSSNRASARSLDSISFMGTLPQVLRQTASKLNLTAKKNITMAYGSSIFSEAGSTISMTAEDSLFIDGTISASAGKIALKIKAPTGGSFDSNQTLWFGEHAQLLAKGAVKLNSDPLYKTGEVLNGGEISLITERGYLVMEQGSKLDVSGTSTVLDIAINGEASFGYQATRIGSDAGSINLVAAEGMVLEGDMKGVGGTGINKNGSLLVKLDRSNRNIPDDPAIPFPVDPLKIIVSQQLDHHFSSTHALGDVLDPLLTGEVIVSADSIMNGGFDYLELTTPDTIQFKGDVNLSTGIGLKLDASSIAWKQQGTETSGIVNLDTIHLALGSSKNRTVAGQPVAGDAIFNTHAQWTDLFGAVRLDNFGQVNLSSQHDMRLKGNQFGEQRDFLGELLTAANLTLAASKIYPTSLTEYKIAVENNPEGRIDIISTGGNNAVPLTAGGSLLMQAAYIRQAGTLLAPLGDINLDASKSLELADGSVTSVSGKGLLVPLGIVQAGLDWLYPLDSVRNLVFDASKEKRISLKAPEINQALGSVVDLSGGGDVFAYEFKPGAGGSSDYLQAGSQSYQNSFAVLPALGTNFAPFDFFQSKESPIKTGETVFLNGGGGLAAGEYAKLPAHYALLPGAFLVTPKSGTQDQGLNSRTIDGRTIVSGYSTTAGTGKRDARSSGFMIETGSQVQQQSQYDRYSGDSFFVNKALENEAVLPVLAKDSGTTSIQAQTKLRLNSLFFVDAEDDGRAARMDIAANNIRVTDTFSEHEEEGVLEILANDLSHINISSLLLGGERQQGSETGETIIKVGADTVSFEENAILEVNDLIVTAKDSISVKQGAKVSAMGDVNTGDKLLTVEGDGALLRVSGSKQVDLNRVSSTGGKGKLIVADGAVLQAKESMLLESSQSTEIAGQILMEGGSLNLAANSINIGEVEGLGNNNALNLSNADLSQMSVDELVLTSRDTVNFYGSTGQVDVNEVFQTVTGGGISPVEISKLVINAAGISGVATAEGESKNDSVNLKVNELELKNTQGLTASSPATGKGEFNAEVNKLTLGDGNFAVSGFDAVNFVANEQFKVEGEGSLQVDADLNVTTRLVTASSQSDYKIDATGYKATFSTIGDDLEHVRTDLTGKLAIKADQVAINTRVAMASGQFGVEAVMGDVVFGEQADIDLSGATFAFADLTRVTEGGTLNVLSDQGSIYFKDGSLVNLNGGDNKQLGGKLKLKATEGNVEYNGDLTAQSGSAEVDVAGFQEAEELSDFVTKLADAGVNGSIEYRSRKNDINIAADTQVNAQRLKFTADKGSIVVAGKLIADAKEDSKIELFAADEVILADGAELSAKTLSTEQGGTVVLSSTDSDHDALSGIDIQAGSSIDVGDATGKHGEVVLRALREAKNGSSTDNSLKIKQVSGLVTGYEGRTVSKVEGGSVVNYKEGNRFYAEGVKIYQDSDGLITSSDINQYKIDANNYMSDSHRLSVNTDLQPDLQLRPGVEVQHNGNLTLNSDLDTVDWRYASLRDGVNSDGVLEKYDATVGQLALRASGDLLLNKSISDGFKDGTIDVETVIEFFGTFFPISESIQVKDKLQSGHSWSFNLVAGADLDSADNTAVTDAGDITIASNVKVRTGSGDIKLTAAGDVNFTSQTSVLYNAGRPDVVSPFGSLSDTIVGFNFYSEYPISGGDIDIKAGGNIKGAKSTQFVNNWLLRQGDWSNGTDHLNEVPTAWGIALGYTPTKSTNAAFANKPLFEQNIASFGGGDVTIVAGGDISDLSVMMPTTGKQVGTPDPDSPLGFLTNVVEVNGGGNMRVIAQGDIAGGAFLLGQGQAELIAGGSIKGGEQFKEGPLLAMGDSQFRIHAGDDINLSSVTDPMILGKGKTNFFSYSEQSSLDISSAAGDIFLGANDSVVKNIIKYATPQSTLAKIYPASLDAAALNGSVFLKDQITLFPSAKGNLNLLAKNNISSVTGNVRLGMSDADRSLLPSAELPVARNQMIESGGRLNPFGRGQLVHASTPRHKGDEEPVRLVTQDGDIGQLQINVAKKSIIKAGNDINNVLLQIQHANAEDSSIIEAKRDIKFTSERDPGTGALLRNLSKIEVAGSGDVLIQAGRDIDLGASDGITTVGDTLNPALADSGANLTLLAGVDKEPDYFEFIKQVKLFKQNYSGNNNVLKDFFMDLEGLTNAELLEMNSASLNKTVMPLFYQSLKIAAKALSKKETPAEGVLGDLAIKALFPDNGGQGDLKLFFSKIQTVDGGNINMAIPRGGINAGLAVAFSGAKTSSELGIVAQREGEVNAFLRDDFMVNQSRIFTLSGGDILAWTSEGNIDAGRGARSAIAAPPPIVSFDEEGNLVIEFPPIVSGSGIRAVSNGDNKAGDVFLVAQKGFIDAGEAGIGGNDFVGVADKFLNGSGLEFSGSTSGVPVAPASAPPVTGLSNTTASVSKAAENTVQNNSDDGDEKQLALGMLSVDVVGYGSDNDSDSKEL